MKFWLWLTLVNLFKFGDLSGNVRRLDLEKLTAAVQSQKRRTSKQIVDSFSDCSFPATNQTFFDISTCNFTLAAPFPGIYSWQKGTPSHATWIGGPSTDASNQPESGYVFFETSMLSTHPLPSFPAKAWLITPIYSPTKPEGNCMRFSYNIQGASASSLRLLRVQLLPVQGRTAVIPLVVNNILLPTVSATLPQERLLPGVDIRFVSPWTPFQPILNQTGWREMVDQVWISSDSTRGTWQTGHLTYSSPYHHAFIFEAVPNPGRTDFRGYIAVDDIQFFNTACDHECEFNNNFCQWSNSADDDFDWSLGRGTLNTQTGPIKDQVSSSTRFNFGGYAFIDSRYPRYGGSKAKLSSALIPATTTSNSSALCFTFWVHMFGEGIGTLRILMQNPGDSQAENELWKLSESGPRETWQRAQITVASTTPFQLKLEAVVGESGNGDIAVDSLRLEDGPCPSLPQGSVNKGIDCTFEQDLCGWVITNSQPGFGSLWSRTNFDFNPNFPNGHIQRNVLPSQGNSYMIFDTYQYDFRPGSRGYMTSPPLVPDTQPYCLAFWVYQASSVPNLPRLGALEVVFFEPNITKESNASSDGNIKYRSMIPTTLWRMEHHQEENWIFGQVSFVPANGGFVSFAATRGNGIRGVIAVDDVTFYKGNCSIQPPSAAVTFLDCSFDLNLCGWNVDNREIPLQSNVSSDISNTTSATIEQSTTPIGSTSTSSSPSSSLAIQTTPGTPTGTSTLGGQGGTTTTLPPSPSSTLLPAATTASSVETTTPFPTTTPVIDIALTNLTTTSVTNSTASNLTSVTDTSISPTSPGTDAATSTTSPGTNTTLPTFLDTNTTSSSTDTTLSTFLDTNTTSSSTDTTLSTFLDTSTTSSGTETTSPGTTPTAVPLSRIYTVPTGNGSSRKTEIGRSPITQYADTFDHIKTFGDSIIEVLATSHDNSGSKSIIISRPGRRNSRQTDWTGYNFPRDGRIVSSRNSAAHSSSSSGWQKPSPHVNKPPFVPSRYEVPLPQADRESSISVFAAGRAPPPTIRQFLPGASLHASTPSPKLYQVSTPRWISSSSWDYNNNSRTRYPQQFGSDITSSKWNLASKSFSLNRIRDHTFQLPEGGYVYFEATGRYSLTRLISAELPGNTNYCLSFYFVLIYRDLNTTLSVRRLSLDNNKVDDLWKISSSSVIASDFKSKFLWLPAQLPIAPLQKGNQIIIIEGSAIQGGVALDDIRFTKDICSVKPDGAGVY